MQNPRALERMSVKVGQTELAADSAVIEPAASGDLATESAG
jgi:hypothetical protein